MNEDRIELQPREVQQLAALAGRMPEGWSLSYISAYRTRTNRWIDGVWLSGPGIHGLGHSLIGNSSVAQVLQMVDVMLAAQGATLLPRGANRGGS